jgi:hypothetical protein
VTLNPQVAVGEYVAEEVLLLDNSVRVVEQMLRLPAAEDDVRMAMKWLGRLEANAERVRLKLEYVMKQGS